MFEEAWSHWPKKVEKKPALEKFKLKARTRDPELIAADIARFGDAYAATTETQFVPGLATWLGKERWTDELPVARTDGKPTPTARAHQTLALATDFLEVER